MAQLCYYPDGTLDPSSVFTPCDASAEFSACCKPTDICVSNGYCFQQGTVDNAWNNRLARALCTDQMWKSSSCPQFCKDVASDSTNSVVLVIDEPVGQFCCGISGSPVFNSTTGQCTQSTQSSPDRPFGTEPFTLNEGQVIYDRSNGAALTNNTQLNASVTVTTAATATSTGHGGNGSNGGKIAAGVAIPLGVLLLAALAAVLFLWNKLKRLERRSREQPRAPIGKSAQILQPHGQLAHPQHRVGAQKYELETEQVYETDGIPRNEIPGSKLPESGHR